MTRTKTQGKKKPPASKAYGALLKLKPAVADRVAIIAAMGGSDTVVRTMPEVAAAFDVRPSTIRQSWKQAGMPGANGKYSLAKIAEWRIEHERQNETAKSASSRHRDELNDIEIESKRLDLMERRARFDAGAGLLVEKDQVRREVAALLAVLQKSLLAIPRQIMPFLPAKVADTVAAEVEKKIRHALKALSEMCSTQIMKGK